MEGSAKFSIVWATDTHYGATNYLKDLSEVALDAGQSINGDGDLVELGYFSEGSFDVPFQNNAFKGEWIPLTLNTRVGDSSSGYGFQDGMLAFRTTFTRNENSVTTYWGEPKSFVEFLDFDITPTNPPPQTTPVCIRFYDSPTKGGAKYNTVSGQNWKWPSFPTASNIPTTSYFKIASGNAPSSSFWIHGSTFEDSDNPFKTSLSPLYEIKIAYSDDSVGSGTFTDINGSYAWGTEISLQATANEHSYFAGWIGDGITEPFNENTTLIVGNSQVIEANFYLEPYLLNLESNGNGEVTGSGSFTFGDSADIYAIADYGHSFSHWEKNGSHFSSNAIETVFIDGELDLVAVFTRNNYNVLVGSDYGGSYEILAANGSVPQTFEHGIPYTLRSLPDKHFGFNSWISSDAGLSMIENKNFAVTNFVPTGDINITASFYELSYQLDIQSSQGYKSLSPSGKFPASNMVTVEVETQDGFIFDYWQDPLGILTDPTSAITEANISMIYPYMSASVSAILRLDDYDELEMNITSSGGGNIFFSSDESGGFTHYSLYELNATPELGYEFNQWIGDTDQLESGVFERNNKFLVEGPISLQAKFSLSEYKLNLSSEGYGTAEGPVTLTIEDNPTIRANAFPGARFTHWSGDTEYLLSHLSSETFIEWNDNSVPHDLNLVANFVPENYQISLQTEGNGSADLFLSSGETFYETVSKTFITDSETQLTIDAIPKEGWSFSNWQGLPELSDLLNPIAFIDQYNSVTYFYPSSDLNLTAIFKITEYDDSQIVISSEIGGDVSIGSEPTGNYLHFSTYDLNATPLRGYEFTGWESDVSLDSFLLNGITSSTNRLRIAGDIAINATFEILKYNLDINESAGGESTAPSTFSILENPALTATEFVGWNFSHWSGDTEYLVDAYAPKTSINHTGLPLQNLNLSANFTREVYDISLNTEGSGILNLSKNGNDFIDGTTEEVVIVDSATRLGVDALPSPGWKFSQWFGLPETSGLRDPTASLNRLSSSIHFIPAADANLTAKFAKEQYSLTIAQSTIGGSATGGGEFLFESVVDVNATPNEHYKFKSWNGGDSYFLYDVNTANNKFQIPAANVTLQPTFEPKIYTISTTSDENGTFSISGTFNNITKLDQSEYNATSQISISAIPNDSENHMLNYLYWENSLGENGYSYSSTFNISFLDGNYSFWAFFTERNDIGYSLTASPPYSGNAGENSAYSSAQLQRLVATPNRGYSFIGWESKSGESFSENWTLHTVDAQLQESSDIWAHFDPQTIFLSLLYDDTQGEVTGFNNELSHGDQLTLTATPDDNYTFVQWELLKEVSFDVDAGFSSIHPDDKRIFINNQEGPELSLIRGFTYHFDCNLSDGDHFFLSTSPSNSTPDSYYTEGVSGHLTSNGVLSIEVPSDAPSTLYYHTSSSNYAGNLIKIDSIEDSVILPSPNNPVFSKRITQHFGLRAIFERTRHTIDLSSIGEGSVGITEQDVYFWGDELVLSATPSDHWYFLHWEGSTEINDLQSPDTTLRVVEDSDVRAIFKKVQYSVDVNASPSEYGLVNAPNQTYTYGEYITLTGTPIVGKQFDEWSSIENLSLDNPDDRYNSTASFKVLGNGRVQANFSRIILDANVELLTLDQNNQAISGDIGASVSTPEIIYHGDSVDFTLSPLTGYTFLYWVDVDSGEIITTQKSFTATITTSRNLQAVLRKNHYQLEVTASDGGVSETNASYPYYWGDKISLLATPDEHWVFFRWTGVGSEYLENKLSPSTYLTMRNDSQITAEFQPKGYTLATTSTPLTYGGFSTIENSYNFGDTVEVEAIPKQGKLFHSWSLDSNLSFTNGSSNTSNPASFTISGNTNLTAKFVSKEYSVAYQVVVVDEFNEIQNNVSGGRILGGKSFYDEDIAEFAISLSNGYKLKHWLDADTNSTLSTEKIYKHTMLSDLNLTAIVTQRKYEVDLKISPSIGGYAQLNDYVVSENLTRNDFVYGSQVSVTATAEDGYRFVKWDTTGINFESPKLTDQAFTIGNDIKLTAYFAPEGLINLTVLSKPAGAASYLFGGGSFEYNLEHSILALPKNGYLFSHWDFNGSEATELVNDVYSNTTTIALDGDKVITAVFKIDESSPPDSDNSNKLYLLSVYSDNTGQGTTSGSGFFRGVRTIKAYPKDGYEFSHWDGGTFSDSYAQTTQVTVLENTSVVAYFQSVGVFDDSESLDNGWWGNPWFGYFWKIGDEDWLFHEKLGWIFMKKKGDQSIWVWIQKMGDWFWTAKEHYPYIHSSTTGSWFFINLEKSNYQRLVIYDYSQSAWLSK